MSGDFKGRREDHRLVTGQGRYAADWNLPGQLYGHFLRSDRAHAELVALNAQPALAAPGVVAVFTGADTAKANFKVAPALVKFPGRGGTALKMPHRDVLANGRVRFVGQEVALVVAESAAGAQDAAEAIEIGYRDLPLVVDAVEALAPGAPLLHADIPGNLCFDFEYGDEAATTEAFARAPHVTRRFSAPAPEGTRERAGFLIAEQPGDLCDAELLFGEVACRKIVPQILQDVRETRTFLAQPSGKCSRAHGKLPRHFVDVRLSMREERNDRVLDARPERT